MSTTVQSAITTGTWTSNPILILPGYTLSSLRTDKALSQIETPFPDHYAQRATYTHPLVYQAATILPNNILAGGNVSHVDQVFFDQDLIYEVDTIFPYALNSNAVKLNSQDMVLIEEAELADPVANYVYLGDTNIWHPRMDNGRNQCISYL